MKINNCRCGRKARLNGVSDERWVDCTRVGCFIGPDRKTEREAIKAWNKVMGSKRKVRKSYIKPTFPA
jgi:hypothetical protein